MIKHILIITSLLSILFTTYGCSHIPKEIRADLACEKNSLWNGSECKSIKDIISRICSKKAGSHTLCKEIINKKYELLVGYREWFNSTRINEIGSLIPVYQSMLFSDSIATSNKSKKRIICKSYDSNAIRCADIAGLAAYYNPTSAITLYNDIQTLEKVSPYVKKDDNTLINCGRGRWISSNQNEDGKLSDKEYIDISDKCFSYLYKFNADYLETVRNSPSVDDFTLRTGIDGIPNVCGLTLTKESDAEKFNKKTLERAQKIRDNCKNVTSPMGSLMEGGTTTSHDGGKTQITVSADGKTRQVVTQNGDGSVTTLTSQVGSNGSVTDTESSSRMNSDGSVSVNTKQTKSDPNSGSDPKTTTTTERIHTDGSGYSRTEASDGNVIYKTYGSWDDSGSRTVNTSIRFPNGQVKNLEPDTELRLEELDGIKNCIDPEMCNACSRYNDFHPEIETACNGGDQKLCQAFGEAAACCGDNNSPLVDPHIVYPDKDGNFQCAGSTENQLTLSACEMQCSFTDNTDCMEGCTANAFRGRDANYDPLTEVCQFAMADWCFESPNKPGVESGKIKPPIPNPPYNNAPMHSIFHDFTKTRSGFGLSQAYQFKGQN